MIHEPYKPPPPDAKHRRVAVDVTFRCYFDVALDVWKDGDDGWRWHIEENYCLDNFVDQLADEIQKNTRSDGRGGICTTCYRGRAKVVDE